MDVMALDERTFQALVSKAQGLKQRRDTLVAQIDAAGQQIDSIERQLVSQYGADYMVRFAEAMDKVSAYEDRM